MVELFSDNPEPPKSWAVENLRPRLSALAARGIYVGTSSWKYEGWCGQVYTEERYHTRGKWSQARFERECLAEYAETFPTVCVDAGYYQFPGDKYIAGLCSQVPDGFRFGFKVTDLITLKHFPSLPRFGEHAGRDNQFFLDAGMFRERFLAPLEPYREKFGPLIFEFTQFQKRDFEHGRDFVAALDSFLGSLPKGWDYGVELRNKGWLLPDYFAVLRQHRVAHVFNNWSRVPSVGEQMALEGAFTADFVVARFLLRPGRSYEESVAAFSPYRETREENPEARDAGLALIQRLLTDRGLGRGYAYVNNRLEGNAPRTIEGFLPRNF